MVQSQVLGVGYNRTWFLLISSTSIIVWQRNPCDPIFHDIYDRGTMLLSAGRGVRRVKPRKTGPEETFAEKKKMVGMVCRTYIHANLLHESVRTMSPSDRGERKCHVQKLTRRQTCCPTIRSTFWRQDVLEKDAHPQAGKESEVGCLLIA